MTLAHIYDMHVYQTSSMIDKQQERRPIFNLRAGAVPQVASCEVRLEEVASTARWDQSSGLALASGASVSTVRFPGCADPPRLSAQLSCGNHCWNLRVYWSQETVAVSAP